MIDAGKRVTRESSMAKLFSSEAAVWIANEAVQIHGGYGFIAAIIPSKNSIATSNFAPSAVGTSEIQRMVIARQLLKD